MKTANLDLLEKSELKPAQARAILQVMESEPATKSDLDALRIATKSDIDALRLATKSDIDALRLATKSDLEVGLQRLRVELSREINGVIRWNFAFWVAQLGAMAAILKLLK